MQVLLLSFCFSRTVRCDYSLKCTIQYSGAAFCTFVDLLCCSLDYTELCSSTMFSKLLLSFGNYLFVLPFSMGNKILTCLMWVVSESFNCSLRTNWCCWEKVWTLPDSTVFSAVRAVEKHQAEHLSLTFFVLVSIALFSKWMCYTMIGKAVNFPCRLKLRWRLEMAVTLHLRLIADFIVWEFPF